MYGSGWYTVSRLYTNLMSLCVVCWSVSETDKPSRTWLMQSRYRLCKISLLELKSGEVLTVKALIIACPRPRLVKSITSKNLRASFEKEDISGGSDLISNSPPV